MSANFIHVGKFVVAPENREKAVAVMRAYEETAGQAGLDHAHLVEDETQPGSFWHVTLWATRADWVAIEKSEAHLKMHTEREALLSENIEHDFFCGNVLI